MNGGNLRVPKRLYLSVFFTLLTAVVFFAEPVLQIARARQTANQPLVARITIQNQEAFLRLSALGLDLLEMRDGDSYFFLTTAEQLEQLRKEGWDVKVD